MSNPGVKIVQVRENSPAHIAGFRVGDRLVAIDNHPIEDILDLQYHFSDDSALIQLERNGSNRPIQITLESNKFPGWELEPLKLRSCKCHCIFCFVDQQPPDLRPALYLKDKDYRFSFLFGNYLTLVGLSGKDLKRILRLRLSPLYVSIHAVNPGIRGRLLGLKSAPVLNKLKRLIAGGIHIHGQIVLIPGINDGEVLEETLSELLPLYPGLSSISVVPVGLTRHRQDLPTLRLLNSTEIECTLDTVASFQRKALEKFSSRWVFPADELSLRAGAVIPDEKYYEEYPQIENGVGLVRSTLQQAGETLNSVKGKSIQTRRLLWITGYSANPILQTLASNFEKAVPGLAISVLAVENNLLGDSVTVAGLLCARDMEKAISNHLHSLFEKKVDAVYLPPDCVNADGYFLDDYTPSEMSKHLRVPIHVFNGDWMKMILGEGLGQ